MTAATATAPPPHEPPTAEARRPRRRRRRTLISPPRGAQVYTSPPLPPPRRRRSRPGLRLRILAGGRPPPVASASAAAAAAGSAECGGGAPSARGGNAPIGTLIEAGGDKSTTGQEIYNSADMNIDTDPGFTGAVTLEDRPKNWERRTRFLCSVIVNIGICVWQQALVLPVIRNHPSVIQSIARDSFLVLPPIICGAVLAAAALSMLPSTVLALAMRKWKRSRLVGWNAPLCVGQRKSASSWRESVNGTRKRPMARRSSPSCFSALRIFPLLLLLQMVNVTHSLPHFGTENGYDAPHGTEPVCWRTPPPSGSDGAEDAAMLLPSCGRGAELRVELSRGSGDDGEEHGKLHGSRELSGRYPLYHAGVTHRVSLVLRLELLAGTRLEPDVFERKDVVGFRLVLCRQGEVGFCHPFLGDEGFNAPSGPAAEEEEDDEEEDEPVLKVGPYGPGRTRGGDDGGGYLVSGTLPLSLSKTSSIEDDGGSARSVLTAEHTLDAVLPTDHSGDYFVIGHVFFFLGPAEDNSTIDYRVDIADAAIRGNIITLMDEPTIQTLSDSFVIAVSIVIGLCVLWQGFLLLSIWRGRSSAILQVAQVPFLALLVVCGAVLISASLFFMPLNDAFCNVSSPLILLPCSLIGSIMVGRIWRAHSILSAVLAFAAGGDNREDKRKFIVMSLLSRLADWNTLFCIRRCKNRCGASSATRRRKSRLREKVTNADLVRLVTILTLPQVIVQIIQLSVFREQVVVELNAERTMGVQQCTFHGRWVAFFGALLAGAVFLLAIFVSWVASDLPSVFNEKHSIFNASWVSVILLSFGIFVHMLSLEMLLSPNVAAGLQIGISILLAFVTSWVLVVPKLVKVWNGKKLILTNLVRLATQNETDWSMHRASAIRTATSNPVLSLQPHQEKAKRESYVAAEEEEEDPFPNLVVSASELATKGNEPVTGGNVVCRQPSNTMNQLGAQPENVGSPDRKGNCSIMQPPLKAAKSAPLSKTNGSDHLIGGSDHDGDLPGRNGNHATLQPTFKAARSVGWYKMTSSDDLIEGCDEDSDLFDRFGSPSAPRPPLEAWGQVDDRDDFVESSDGDDHFDREDGLITGGLPRNDDQPDVGPTLKVPAHTRFPRHSTADASFRQSAAVFPEAKFSRRGTTGSSVNEKVILRKDGALPRTLEMGMLRTQESVSVVINYTMQGQQPPLDAWRNLKLDAISLGQQMQCLEFGWTESENKKDARAAHPNRLAQILSSGSFTIRKPANKNENHRDHQSALFPELVPPSAPKGSNQSKSHQAVPSSTAEENDELNVTEDSENKENARTAHPNRLAKLLSVQSFWIWKPAHKDRSHSRGNQSTQVVLSL